MICMISILSTKDRAVVWYRRSWLVSLVPCRILPRIFHRGGQTKELVLHNTTGKDFRENESYKEKEKAIEKANEMYNVYCKEGAEHQVNLPCHMRTNI